MAQTLRTDWVLFVTIVVMVCLGLVFVYSASSTVATLKFEKESHYFLVRQAIYAVLGFATLMWFKRMDYRKLCSPLWAFGGLGIVVFSLLLVYFLDPKTHRWFRFGGVSIQPSEFAKPALAIFLAWFVSRRLREINEKHTLLPALFSVVLMGLVVVIPDFGTALVLVFTALTVFFVAGLKKRYLAAVMLLGFLLGTIAILQKPYRLVRVVHHFDPEQQHLYLLVKQFNLEQYLNRSAANRDPKYQVRQSKIAIGSGGILGVGLMQSKQKLFYLPEAHTDFIYAVVGEEAGLWGCGAILFGFLIIAWRGFRLFWLATDDFGRYLALAITVSIVFQAFVNLSVVLDMVPTKGIPLPMISNGGSSLLSTLTQLGILLSISERAA